MTYSLSTANVHKTALGKGNVLRCFMLYSLSLIVLIQLQPDGTAATSEKSSGGPTKRAEVQSSNILGAA